MAREPRPAGTESPSGGSPGPAQRQRHFGEADDGWTLIGPSDDVEAEPTLPADPARDEPPEAPPAPAIEAAPPAERPRDPEPWPAPPAATPFVELPAPSREPPPARGPLPGPAPIPDRPRPAYARAVAALALLGLAALAWRHARVVRALEEQLAEQRARAAPSADAAELERLRGEAQRLERELSDVARLAAAAETTAAGEGRERERALALAAERDALQLDLDAARDALGRAEARADASEARLQALDARAGAHAIGPPERRAELCDRVLARVEAGQGQAAGALLQSGWDSGVFARGGRDGAEFLAALAAAAEALERARQERATSTSPASGAALAALGRLDLARAGLADFAREGADWLARDPRGGPAAEPAARAERAARALESLEAEGADLAADIDALHAEDWAWIAARGALQDPALAAEHARAFGCGHLGELARDAAAALAAEALFDGVPQPERLLAAESLPVWAELLGARAADARSADEDGLLWLDAARRWYALGAGAEDFAWHGLTAPEVRRRARDWRAELWLRVALAAPGSAWPPRPGEVTLFRLSGPSRARWRSDRRVDEGRADGWSWQRTHYDAEGAALGEPARVEVELRDGRARLVDAELVLLDLRGAQPDSEVAPAPDAPIVTPPAATGFGEVEVLGLAAEATRSTCLVVRQGDTTRWFSPRLGLVLEERELASGSARVELVLREEQP